MTTIYPLTWDLDSILETRGGEAIQAALAEQGEALRKLAAASEVLPAVGGDAEIVAAWRAFLTEYEGIFARGGDVSALIGCHAAADAGNTFYQSLEARLAALEPLRNTIATNVELALRDADETTLAAFLEADPMFKENAFYFEDARRRAVLRLPSAQEQFASELDVDGFSAWGRLYDRLSGKLRVAVMERGELVKKSPGQVPLDSPERSVRENNFYAADKAWASIAETCADCLNHISGTRLTKYRHLGLRDHLDAPLLLNRMRRETLEQMWSVVAGRRPILTRYLNEKARLLGLDKLTWYDLAAPLPAGTRPSETLPYDEACRIVVETFHGFSPDLGEFGEMALRSRWVEAENRPGKRQGGFCTDLPRARQSRIFMTYTESADSMSTLAHELGHAYHSHVLREDPFFLRDYPMNLAETASTFAEHVLGQVRLDRAEGAIERRAILDQMLGDSVGFCMNIHTRFVFEDRLHQARAHGELSAEELGEFMLAAQRECYCGALAEDGYNPRFWASKLHFYITDVPFYNFPYTFGYLLSLGLFTLARREPAGFAERYRSFLRATGRLTAEEAVAQSFGYDLTKPEFWNEAMDEVEERVGMFIELGVGD